jgi:hypothetical protein
VVVPTVVVAAGNVGAGFAVNAGAAVATALVAICDAIVGTGIGVTAAAALPAVVVVVAVVTDVVVVDAAAVALDAGVALDVPAGVVLGVTADAAADVDVPADEDDVPAVDVLAVVLPEPVLGPETPLSVVAVVPPAELAETAVVDAPPPESARAWFVDPDVLLYLTVSAPEGDVAPCSTAVSPVNNVSAIDCGVCTSPRTSSDVSRFDE